VRAVTEIDSKGMSWGSNNKITINYLVNMPETCFLEAANKYGNVDVETLTNGATFNIGYGAISTESISGKTSLELAYSKGRLGSLNDIYVEVKYSELGIEKCSNAMVQSKYSQLRIKEVARLELESKYGDFEIGKVTELINEGKYDVFSIGELGTLSLESSYSDIEIESLAKSISLELKYGNFSLDKVMKGFSEISVEAQYADVKIGMEKGVSMRLNLSGKYIDVNVPDSFVTTTDDKDDSRQRQIIGHLESSSGAPVNISMSYGNINIK
jgi:hypothetical protein